VTPATPATHILPSTSHKLSRRRDCGSIAVF
jgi:hypothetical protein